MLDPERDDPSEQPRIVRLLLDYGRAAWMLVGILVALGLLGFVFTRIRLILLAIFVALVHAAIVTPIGRWLEDRGFARTPATALGLLLVVSVFGTMTAVTGYRLVVQLPELAEDVKAQQPAVMEFLQRPPLSLSQAEVDAVMERTMDRIQASSEGGGDLMGGGEDTAEEATTEESEQPEEEEPSDGRGPSVSTTFALLQGSAAAIRLLGFGLVGVVLSFFLVRDRDRITEGFVRHLAGGEHDSRARDVLRAAWHALLGYVRASVLIGAVEAAAIGMTLVIVGTPLAASLTVLTFLAAFVPVVGATAAGALAVLLTWLGVGTTQAIVVAVVVLVVQQFDSHVLQPSVVAQHTHLHPIATILALLVGGLVGGVLGALLAVPTTAVLVAVAGELLDPEAPEPVVT